MAETLAQRMRRMSGGDRPLTSPYDKILREAASELERLEEELSSFREERSYIVGHNHGWDAAMDSMGFTPGDAY